MRLRLRLKPLPRQGSDGRINQHRLNLMSNPRGVKGSPYLEEFMAKKKKGRKGKGC